MKPKQLGKYSILLEGSTICWVKDKDKLSFRTGEVEALQSLLNAAAAMEQLPVVPDHITGSPFEIRFEDAYTLRILRPGLPAEPGVKIEWGEIFDVVSMLQQAVQYAIDRRLHRPPSRPTGSFEPNEGQITEV